MRNEIFCYSRDGENYHGSFATRDEAIAEAQSEVDSELSPGESANIYTGESRDAMHFLRKWEQSFGEDVIERAEEWLCDNHIGSDDTIIEISAEKRLELGKLIADFIEKNATFNRWGVAEVQQVEYIVPEQSETRELAAGVEKLIERPMFEAIKQVAGL